MFISFFSYKIEIFYLNYTIRTTSKSMNVIMNNIDGIEPEIIYLEDCKKIKDNDGNIIDIETRGERKVDKIYFKVKDVMKGFEMKFLNKTILDKRNNGYIEGIHYKLFNCKKIVLNTNNTIIKKVMYLTYIGILRVLFASHSPRAHTFVKWATESLFTLQMGIISSG